MVNKDPAANSEQIPAAPPIAIIGMSCMFPKAQSLEQYWGNIKDGVDAITDVPDTHWNPDHYFDEDPKAPDRTYSRRGGFLSPVEFSPVEFGVSPNSIEATDSSQLLGLIVAQGALKDAGYGPGRDFDRNRVSTILGVTGTLELSVSLGARLGHPRWREALARAGVAPHVAEEVVRSIGDSYVAWQEESFPGLLGNVVAGRIANRLDLGGTNCVVDAACASSISAAHMAVMELASGRCNMAITGGVDTFNDIFMYMCFSKTPALSPTGDSRPFSADADGTILGEGIGMVVLKRLEDARRDDDRIYAVIKGIGASSDGRGKAIYAPAAPGQVEALKQAYAVSGVSPATVELVEGHGTGTKVGDATEVTALKEVYGAARNSGPWCALGSVKSQIGHTKAAAGVAGLIKAVMALRHKVLPPTIKIGEPNPAVNSEGSPFYLSGHKRPWIARKEHPRRAAVSSFGFGGSNFHMVLEEDTSQKAEIDWDGAVQIVAISAESEGDLKSRLEELRIERPWEEIRSLARKSRRDFSSRHPYRLVFVIEKDKTDVQRVFTSALKNLEKFGGRTSWSTPDGAYFGKARKIGKLGFLFPGQGSQYVGMCLDLACVFPKMQEVLTEANVAYGEIKDLAIQLSDFIFPIPALDEELRKLNELALRATHVAQPAIGAVSLGTLCILAMFGLHPEAAAGHSFGELMALLSGGRIDVTALHELSKLRGELMAQGSGDRGSMLAVQATPEEIRRALDEEKLDLVIANRNAPRQGVLSGRTADIERAIQVFNERNIKNKQLPVSAAFHSSLVSNAEVPFREALDRFDFQTGSIPVYSNSTGGTYPEDADEARDLLAGQLARPVNFVAEIENMYADGVTTFVEVGPGRRLTGLVDSILGEREHVAIATDQSSGRGSGLNDLARSLAQLAALGYPVDLPLWDAGDHAEEEVRPGEKRPFTVTISGANYRKPREENGAHTPAPPPVSTEQNPPTLIPSYSQEGETMVKSPDLETPIQPPEPPPRGATGAQPSAPPPTSQAAPSFSSKSPHTNQSSSANPASSPSGGEAVGRPMDSHEWREALRATQESVAGLQRLQQQTADLHRQFLENQEKATAALHDLIESQGRLFGLGDPRSGTRAVRPGAPIQGSLQAPTQADESAAIPTPAPEPTAEPVQPISQVHSSNANDTSGADANSIREILLEIVSEKTGYPTEMLNPDMDMESDLGIDSIKRVEILSAVQERLPDAPTVQPEQLSELRTLAQIIEFLTAESGEAARASSRQPSGEPARAASTSVSGDSSAGRLSPSASSANGTLESALIEIVSDKTGYPPEMLNPDMDLEADLGIDSIKRVEILSALQERFPEAPVVQPEDLGKLSSLRQIIDFIGAAGASDPPPAETAPPSTVTTNGASNEASNETTNGAKDSSESNGTSKRSDLKEAAPSTAGRQDLDRAVLTVVQRDAQPGAARVKIATDSEIWVTDEESGLAAALVDRLDAIGLDARVVSLDELDAMLEAPQSLGGLILLAPAYDSDTATLWPEISESFLKRAFGCAKLAAAGLGQAALTEGSLFVTVSRLDGSFGLAPGGADFDPLPGALAGLTKTAAHEWPSVACKAIDVPNDWTNAEEIADALVDELFIDGPVEVGLTPTGRNVLEVVDAPRGGDPGEPVLQAGDVVVISGGARGVTAETALALAEAYRPKLVLLGRSPEPTPEPPWLADLTDEREMKRALLNHNGVAPPSPQELEERYQRHIANREIARNLERIEAAGAKVVYRCVDVRDGDAVQHALAETRKRLGPIRALIHGAGVLADRRIEEKSIEQFEAVFETKVLGLRNLIGALRPEELRCLVLFSSASARYGRTGQADYAMANEALNKIAWRHARLNPACKVLSINWGPWEGGMVTPGLKKLFESEGVALIESGAGAQFVIDEMNTRGTAEVEIIAGGRFPSAAEASPKAKAKLSVAFERLLSVESHDFLRSHVIDGHPVLPVAMIVEWLAHGALHGSPGYVFQGFDDFRLLKGLTLEGAEPYPIRVLAAAAEGSGEALEVSVELRGGESDILHAKARVHLGAAPTKTRPVEPPPQADLPYPRSVRDVYREILFHGPLLHGINEVSGWSRAGMIGEVAPAPTPASWMDDPVRSAWVCDPLCLDSALQLFILWNFECQGEGSLPVRIESYRQFQPNFGSSSVVAILRGRSAGAGTVVADIDFVDKSGRPIARMEGCEMAMSPTLIDAFQRRSIPAPAVS